MAMHGKPFEHKPGQGAPGSPGQGAKGKMPDYVGTRRYLSSLMKKYHNLPLEIARDCLLALGKQVLFEKFLGKVDRRDIGIFMGKVGGKCIARYIENGGDNAGEIINRRGGIEIGEFLRMAVHHNPEIGSVEAGKFVGMGNIEKVEGFLKGFGGGPSGMFIYVAGGENMARFLDEVDIKRALKYAKQGGTMGAREIRTNFAEAVKKAKALPIGGN